MSYSILITLECILENAPKMAVNIGDKFELEIFRPTVANESELKNCLIFLFQ